MEKLKAVLADKILDLSITSNSDDVKSKIDKIQRFRDFANACQTLMKKYPQIEDELITMVESNDYDTKVASSRVDTIIRLADSSTEVKADEFKTEIGDNAIVEVSDDVTEALISETYEEQDTETVWLPEDTDYEELEVSDEEDPAKGYVAYEELNAVDTQNKNATIVEIESNSELSDEEIAAKDRKAIIKKVLQILAVIAAVIVVIIVVKFVLIHWETILIVSGILLALAGVLWYIKRSR